jgi:protease PrsW
LQPQDFNYHPFLAATVAFGGPMVVLLLVLAVAPTVFLLWFFYNADRYKRESRKLLSATFLLGALMVLPAGLIELFLALFIPNGPGLLLTFVYFVFGVAVVEESLKLSSVRIYAFRSPSFNEPMDGLVLGVAGALGFATVENILYVLEYGFATAVVRALTAVPSHALYGAISGYYLGEAKFRGNPILAFRGLAIAIVLHATFDTVATVYPTGAGVLALIAFTALIYFGVVRREIEEAETESPFKPRRERKPGSLFERIRVRTRLLVLLTLRLQNDRSD